MASRRAWAAIAAGVCIVVTALLFSGVPSASAANPVFTATPHTNSAGGTETITAVDKCPAPQGAGDWVANVKVAQGGNSEVSFQDFLVANDGSWGGKLTLPKLTSGPAQLVGKCFDAKHLVTDEIDYTPVDLTITAPATSSAAPSTSTASSTSAAASTPASSSSRGALANTGFRYTTPFTVLGAGALLAGLVLLFAGRRGKRAH
jgi:hypothetical protein